MIGMFEENINLVYWLVTHKYKHCRNREDLIQEGCIGLLKAIKVFDASRRLKFSTFAVYCIDNQIKMFLRKRKTINFTDVDYDDFPGEDLNFSKLEYDLLIKNLSESQKYILQRLLQGVTQQEIANELGVSQATIGRKFKQIKEIIQSEN